MAMKTCRECGKDVSSEAKTCPSCGISAPVKSGPSKLMVFGGGFVAFCFLVGALGGKDKSGGGDTSSSSSTNRAAMVPVPEEPPIPVHAKDVAADNRFKGKRLAVIGTLQDIDKTAFDEIVLKLAAKNRFMGVRAYLEKSEASKAATLAKGQTINLVCKGGGRIVGSAVLRDCTVQ